MANGPPDELRSNYIRRIRFSWVVFARTPAWIRFSTGSTVFPWAALDSSRRARSRLRSGAPTAALEGEWPTAPGYSGSPIFETSADFTHYVFQTGSAPSLSLIDDNTVTNTTTEVSKTASGPIPIQPGDTTPEQESLRVPAVSSDGTHILIAARSGPLHNVAIERQLCGLVPEGSRPESKKKVSPQVFCPLQPSQLYMRVDDAVTYEIAPDHAVEYVGETPDGSKVFFTSEEHLTSEDPDHGGASLYMWSQKGGRRTPSAHPHLQRGSRRPRRPRQYRRLSRILDAACGVMPFVNNSYSEQAVEGYVGGNGLSDNSIASANGDIYFFSPEQLAGPGGQRPGEPLRLS